MFEHGGDVVKLQIQSQALGGMAEGSDCVDVTSQPYSRPARSYESTVSEYRKCTGLNGLSILTLSTCLRIKKKTQKSHFL